MALTCDWYQHISHRGCISTVLREQCQTKMQNALRANSRTLLVCGVDANAQMGQAVTEAEKNKTIGQQAKGTRNSRGRRLLTTIIETRAQVAGTFTTQECGGWTHTQVREGRATTTWIDHILVNDIGKTNGANIIDVPLGINSTDHRPLENANPHQ